jgi:universal stress protein A
MTTITRILVPTDFSAASDAAFDYAVTLAGSFKASLVLLYVFEDPFATAAYTPAVHGSERLVPSPPMIDDDQTQLGSRVARARQLGLSVTSHFVLGSPSKIIPEYAAAEGIDLIVMGTHGRTGVAHLILGSVAERVVRMAPCPVLAVKGAGRLTNVNAESAYASAPS